ncbi:MAG: 50S ribosomal protein L6 [Candidatus Paceibacteria bacterium]
MQIPDGVTISVDGLTVKVKGPKGEVEKTFKAKGASIEINGSSVEVLAPSPAIKGTLEAHIRNMVKGVQDGYTRKLKLIYAHFPFTLEIKGQTVKVKNLLGEKLPRTFNVIGNTKVEVKGQDVTISGPDKEAVGQTVANFKRSLRIKDKDCRVFQDGAYEVV